MHDMQGPAVAGTPLNFLHWRARRYDNAELEKAYWGPVAGRIACAAQELIAD